MPGSIRPQRFLDISEEEYELMMDVNVRSVVLCTQAVARRIAGQGSGGTVVNICLDSRQRRTGHAQPLLRLQERGRDVYPRRRQELGEHNIRVNAVSPGLIWREGLDEAWPEGVARYRQAAALSSVGTGRGRCQRLPCSWCPPRVNG